MAAIFMMALCGCSNEDVDDLAFDKVDDLSFVSEEIFGTWELEHCYNPAAGQFSINKGESIVEFKDGNMINVKSQSSTYFDEYFLPSGQYSCKVSDDLRIPEENFVLDVVETGKENPGRMPFHSFDIRTDGDKLIFNVYAAHESHYPMLHITYTFHKKNKQLKTRHTIPVSSVVGVVPTGDNQIIVEPTDEGLALSNPVNPIDFDNWWWSKVVLSDDCLTLQKKHNYIVRLTMKVPSDGMYQVVLYGSGFTNNSLCQVPVTAGDDFQVIDVDFWSDGHIFFQSGWVVGTTILKKVEILEKVSGNTVAIKTAKVSKADDTIYNLAGQRVDSSYRGVVIKNGKKFVK